MAESAQEPSSGSRQGSATTSPEVVYAKPNGRSTASIRVSRACIYCRSKHVRCDGTMPTCKRCVAENRTCFYAKSRRGIRDAKERSLISDKPPVARTCATFPHASPIRSLNVQPHVYANHDYGYALINGGSMSPVSNEDTFLAAYYAYFHPSHSMSLPKHHFLKYLKLDPEPMQFLLSVVRFVGSLYTPRVPAEELREAAFSAACGPLPMTPQSVLGLLILSIVALGETKFEYQNGWTDRAISMAHQIGMQNKSFANTTLDPILAECHRRVYWGLHLLDCMRIARDPDSKSLLNDGVGDVDLPCEEWEYDAGQIPPPISLMQYDIQNNLGAGEFSSWTYLVDMCRISRKLNMPYQDALDEKKMELLERVDGLICDWLIKLPQWKMDLVDAGGLADMVLFHAIAFAQQNRLRIRQCTSRQGLDLRQTFPLGPARGPNRQAQKVKMFGWNAIPIDVQAANSVCSLFQQSFPTKNLSPLCLPGLLLVAVAYLDACVFLGLDSPTYREKLNMILHIMTVHGELWPISRKVAEEVREVAKDYSILPPLTEQDAKSDVWISNVVVSSAMPDDIALTTDFGFQLYPDLELNDWASDPNGDSS